MADPEELKRVIERYRRLLDLTADERTRTALRSLISEAEDQLAATPTSRRSSGD